MRKISEHYKTSRSIGSGRVKSFNINDVIKVKLNEVGLAIYSDRAKEINKKFEENNIKYR